MTDWKVGSRVIQQIPHTATSVSMPPRHGTITHLEGGIATIEWDEDRTQPMRFHVKDFPLFSFADPLA